MWYNLNLKVLAAELLPILWRKPRMLTFLWSLITPVQSIYFEFMAARKRNIYRAKNNWMKCYLQTALNDEFDPQQRRITIDEILESDALYIYNHGMFIDPNLEPTYLDDEPVYLEMNSAYDDTQDFIVNLHSVQANFADVRALVDYYKMDGTRYKIIGFTTTP